MDGIAHTSAIAPVLHEAYKHEKPGYAVEGLRYIATLRSAKYRLSHVPHRATTPKTLYTFHTHYN